MKIVREEYNRSTNKLENTVVFYGFHNVKKFKGGFFEREIIYIRKIIFNPPATIVFWTDGTKTVVKCKEDDIFDKETGLAMAICKRMFSRSEFKKLIKEAGEGE